MTEKNTRWMRWMGFGGVALVLGAVALACGGTSFDAMSPKAAEQMVGAPAATSYDVDHDTESYDHVRENAFLAVKDHPLSTFSVDVDTASYSNVRRFLREGSLPPDGAVRIEELVNYFSYDYPDPEGDRPFSVTSEVGAAPWNPKHQLVHIGLQGKRMAARDLPPRNLVFLLDVSGSMGQPNKLPLLKRSLKELCETLTERDHVAIVVYAGASGLVLPPTSGDQETRILDALEKLEAGGSTNGAAGIQLAYEVAHRSFNRNGINRVILATDGDFNVGTTSQSELVDLIEQEREGGVYLTVLGFGMGNYKDSTLEKLADQGNGNYAYIDTINEARKVLVQEAGATLVTLAKDVKIQVELNPAEVSAYRLIGYENRLLQNEDFNDDKKDAGEIGAGHSVTALYEVVPAGQSVPTPGVDALKYQKPRQVAAPAANGELMTVKLRFKRPTAQKSELLSFAIDDAPRAKPSETFRFSAAVAGFGMLLRGSEHKGSADWKMVSELASGAVGSDSHGYRREFLGMVRRASELAPGGQIAR